MAGTATPFDTKLRQSDSSTTTTTATKKARPPPAPPAAPSAPQPRRTKPRPDGPDPNVFSLPTVQCPVCSRDVPVPSTSVSPDEALSEHLDSRRCRPIAESQTVIEIDCSDDGEEDAWKLDFVGVDSSDDDDDGSMEDDLHDDDLHDDDLLDDDPWFNAVNHVVQRSSSKPAPTSSSTSSYTPPPKTKDDMHPADFDDRVKSWVAAQDGTNSALQDHVGGDAPPPGPATLRNGLVVPAYINDRLFEYQRTGLRWMWELHCQGAGGIVGDEMGLGKTVQVSAFLGTMAVNKKLDSVLVIVPATMLQHWLNELAQWAPGLRRVLLHKSGEEKGGSLRKEVAPVLRHLDKWLAKRRKTLAEEARERRNGVEIFGDSDSDDEEKKKPIDVGAAYVVVTTYDALRREDHEVLLMHPWSYAIMDEGQKIRNPDTSITLATKQLRTVHRLLLSGTPIQNNLRELWSLFDFVFPGRLGTLPAFETEFSEPIKVGGYANATPMQVQLAYRCALVLKDLINPYLLRRQKKDIKEVLRMPGKTEQTLFIRLSPRQRQLYEQYIMGSEVQAVNEGRMRCFRPIGILRKLCNHPDLVSEDDLQEGRLEERILKEEDKAEVIEDDDEGSFEDPFASSDEDDEEEDADPNSFVNRSGKLQVLAKILPLWKKEGHRVLIFCQTRQMLNLIERFVKRKGLVFRRMDGNTAVGARQGLIDRFNGDESIFGMLLTTKTGGVGVNFTGASRIILFDPDWNPQTDKQANERAWRFGQKKEVTVYRMITAGTIEEKIYHRQIFKTNLSNKVLQDPRQRRLFSQNDLKDFFTLKAEGSEGITETGDLMGGVGVIDQGSVDVVGGEGVVEDRTLEKVMKSSGLAGVFDHDFVDTSSDRSLVAREMEDKAKSVARRAAAALKASVGPAPAAAGANPDMVPTFTGRFGGGGASAGILAQIGARAREVATAGASRGMEEGALPLTDNYTRLMHRLKNFIIINGGERGLSGGGPTTDQLLKEFSSVPDRDAAIFKRMLNTLAARKGARWKLREEV